MVSKHIASSLSGNEVVRVSGFAIAYNATLEAPGGGHSFGTVGGPTMIQLEQIPAEMHEPILALIRAAHKEALGAARGCGQAEPAERRGKRE